MSKSDSPSTSKRLKSTHNSSDSNHDDDDDDDTSPSVCDASAVVVSMSSVVLQMDCISNQILLLIGDYQYRFVASVDKSFLKAYVSLYPRKRTYVNASTIQHAKVLLDDIEALEEYDDEDEDENEHDHKLEDCIELRNRLMQAAVRNGNLDVVKGVHQLMLSYECFVYYQGCADAAIQYGQTEILVWLLDNIAHVEDDIDWVRYACWKAAEYGRLDYLQLFMARGSDCYSKDDEYVCQCAIANGHMDFFHWAVKQGFVWDNKNDKVCLETAHMAAANGKLVALQWLHANGCDIVGNDEMGDDTGCFHNAVANGHLEVARWLHTVDCQWDDDILEVAVRYGNLDFFKGVDELQLSRYYEGCAECAIQYNKKEILEWMLDNVEYEDDDRNWKKEELCCKAAECGRLDYLQLFLDRGSEYYSKDDIRVCQYAIGNGHLDVFRWAVEQGFVWDNKNDEVCRKTAYIAARNGQLKSLKWLHTNGCGITGNGEVEDDLNADPDTECFDNAVKNGNLEVIRWLHSVGCQYDDGIIEIAVRYGTLETVKVIHQLMLSDSWDFDYEGCAICAIKYEQREILVWLLDSIVDDEGGGGDWKKDVGLRTIENGQFDLFRMVASRGSNFCSKDDVRICQYAIGYGHMNVYHWAVKQGFVWDITNDIDCQQAGCIAASHGKFESLQWLYTNGCNFMGKKCFRNAVEHGKIEVVFWLHGIGCPRDDDVAQVAIRRGNMELYIYLSAIQLDSLRAE